jgi:hypothetical protein
MLCLIDHFVWGMYKHDLRCRNGLLELERQIALIVFGTEGLKPCQLSCVSFVALDAGLMWGVILPHVDMWWFATFEMLPRWGYDLPRVGARYVLSLYLVVFP